MLKTIKKYLLFIIIIGVVSFGCRKGKEDPFISLRSRDNRLIGKWNLIKMNGYIDLYDTNNIQAIGIQCYYDPKIGEYLRYSKIWGVYGYYLNYEEYESSFYFNEDFTTYSKIEYDKGKFLSDGVWEWDNDAGKKKEHLYISDLNLIEEAIYNDVASQYLAMGIGVNLIDIENINNFQIIKLSNSELKLRLTTQDIVENSDDISSVKVIYNITFEKDLTYDN